MERFERTRRLIGSEALERLFNSKVLVFGVGGVGSYVVEALARSGVGEIVLFDCDIVAKSNINRQIIATEDTVGKPKVDVAKERILSINPNATVVANHVFVDKAVIDSLDFSGVSYIVDAIDNVTAKIALVLKAKEQGVNIISSMGTGNKLHPEMLKIADISKTSVCPLARVMRYELRRLGVNHLKVLFSEEKPITPQGDARLPASISFVPSVAGLLIAGEVIRDIAKI
jgi:tRNA A37 threonylcarbamoyladenosine dehydratase